MCVVRALARWVFPPTREVLFLIVKHYRRTNHRREQPVAPPFACSGDSPVRGVPGVPGERELADMARQQGICVQVLRRSRRFLGRHVDEGPALVVLTGIEGYEVKSPESATDLGEVRSVTRVTTDEDPPLGSRNCVADPECLVPAQQTPRVMTRGQHMNRKSITRLQDREPIGLVDFFPFETPTLEVCSNAKPADNNLRPGP